MKAGKVSPFIFVYELWSKGKRSLEKIELPEELKNPKGMLSLVEEETALNYERISIEKSIKKILSDEIKEIVIKREPSFLATVFKVKAKVNGEEKLFAYKKYTDIGSLKWIPIELYIFPAVRFFLLPKKRMINEFLYNFNLRNIGFKTPKIYALNWKSNSILMEYITGKPLSNYISELTLRTEGESLFVKAGELLARVHSNNICLVDTKPQNMIVDENGDIYLTDLEQARMGGDRSWDIALHIFYGIKFTFNKKWARRFASCFVEGYLKNGEREYIKKAASIKYLRIFLPLSPLTTIKAVADVLKQA